MIIKSKSFFIIVLFFFCLNINTFSMNGSDPEQKVFKFFDDLGFIQSSKYIYHNRTMLTNIEKAEIISDIANSVFDSEKKYSLKINTLKTLRKMIQKYKEDILIVGKLDPYESDRKLNSLLYSARDIKFGYTPDVKKGIKARDILKTKKIQHNKNTGDIIVKSDSGIRVVKGNIGLENIIGYSINKKSYFSLGYGMFEPDTSLSYVNNSGNSFFEFGYQRTTKIAYSIRSNYWEDSSNGTFFGGNSDYKLKLNSTSFSIKLFIFNLNNIIPYAGYGLTKMNYAHYLNGVKTEDSKIFPHMFYGAEMFYKKGFSIFGELYYYLSDKQKLNINGTDYSIETDDFSVNFGIKFYFNG